MFTSITKSQKKAIENWWKAFQRDHEKILSIFFEKDPHCFDLPAWVKTNLKPIDKNLMWEFSLGTNKKMCLVITPEQHSDLRPLVRYMLTNAPEMTQWEFSEYRLPQTFESAVIEINQRIGMQDISNIQFIITEDDFNRIDFTFYVPFSYKKIKENNSLYLLLEMLLGEEAIDKWVGNVDVKPISKLEGYKTSNHTASSIIDLKAKFLSKKTEIQKRYNQSYMNIFDTTNWILFEFESDSQKIKSYKNYSEKNDIHRTLFIEGNLFAATYSGRNFFYSDRFSNRGEHFIYIKNENDANDTPLEGQEKREAMEQALNDSLVQHKLGCVIGSGLGEKYSYIDLAITNFEESISEIKCILQKHKLFKKSWILFHDVDLRNEWIGIDDSSGKPPE